MKHKVLRAFASLSLMIVVSVVLWLVLRPEPSVRGQRDAHSDIARGHYRQLNYGYPMPWTPEYTHLLRERYGIEVRTVAFCTPSESEVEYFRAYNAVSTEAAIHRFGHDIFAESVEEARTHWYQKTSTPTAVSRSE